MAGEKQQSDLPVLKTEGDKKFQKDMEQRLVIDMEAPDGKKGEVSKSWEKLLQRIDDSLKSDKGFRETIRKAADNPELSKELREHLRKLVETADERDKEIGKSKAERQKFAGEIPKTGEKAPIDADMEKLGVSPKQIEEFVTQLMKDANWKKALVSQMASTDVMLKIVRIQEDTEGKLKIPKEFREFLAQYRKATEAIHAKVKEYTDKNIVKSYAEAKAFAENILKDPGFKEKLTQQLKASRSYRIKFYTTMIVLFTGMVTDSSSEGKKDAEKYTKALGEFDINQEEFSADFIAEIGLDEKQLRDMFGAELASLLAPQAAAEVPKKPIEKPKFKPAFSASDDSEKKPADKKDPASADSKKPGEPGAKVAPGNPEKKDKSKEGLVDIDSLKKMSMGELLGQMFESLGKISAGWGTMFEKKSAELTGKVAAKFTDEELDKIALDLQKGKDTKFQSQDQATEYVCSVLNLPVRKTPQEFLQSLQLSGLVLDMDMDHKKDMKVGDVIFFQKVGVPGVPSYIAVISSVEPYRITTVPENGGNPQEMLLDQSSYYKNGWYGFMKIPRKEGQAPPVALQKP